VGSVSVEDLNDVTVGSRIQELKRVGPGGENFPGDFHGLAKGDHGFFVPLISASAGEHGGSQGADCEQTKDCFYDFHANFLLKLARLLRCLKS
jgi:hypothetical protein